MGWPRRRMKLCGSEVLVWVSGASVQVSRKTESSACRPAASLSKLSNGKPFYKPCSAHMGCKKMLRRTWISAPALCTISSRPTASSLPNALHDARRTFTSPYPSLCRHSYRVEHLDDVASPYERGNRPHQL